MRRTTTAGALLLCLSLAGCGSDGMDDLRAFVQHAGTDRKPVVEPIPELKPQETFRYAAETLRDPFSPDALKQTTATSGPKPDLTRRKEPLEQFPLDALKMVGTLEQGHRRWAIIQAPDGTVYRVHVGNYMGQNYGKVVRITDDKVRLVEFVSGPTGAWVERDADLALAE